MQEAIKKFPPCALLFLFALFFLLTLCFYLCRAVSITLKDHTKEAHDRKKKLEKCPDEFNDEKFFVKQKWVEVTHQIWFNALGLLIGWVAAYYLWETGISNFKTEHFVALIIAYLGITGHLPQAALLGRAK